MSLQVSRILHAGYIFESAETTIAFDPIFENPFSRNCYAFPGVKFQENEIRKLQLDAVFISHFHDDHCSFDSLNLLDRKIPIYMYCIYDEMFALLQELGFENIHELWVDQAVVVGSFEIIVRRALDSGVDSVFHIKAGGLNVLNVVDSWLDPVAVKQLAEHSPWDMVLWPFQTMREIEVLSPSRASFEVEWPAEWIEQLQILNPRFIVPSSCQFVHESWSWYNRALFPISYSKFSNTMQSALPHSIVVKLDPGTSVVLDESSLVPSQPLAWVELVGAQDLDYTYDAELGPPLTADVARNFSSLTPEKTALVFEYCRRGLIDRYRLLDSSVDYFRTARIWKLSVFNENGKPKDFYYEVDNATIELVSEDVQPTSRASLAWSTEIPIFKFHAALTAGETLTSMYVRINDVTFSPEIEQELKTVDVVDDPLARCLFNGVFGAYQLAQLRRLQARDDGSAGASSFNLQDDESCESLRS